MHIEIVTIIVAEYDPAVRFFVDTLGFELVEDSPSTTNDGRPKRWIVVRPPGAVTGILLARADGEHQTAAVGHQMAGRVGFFLRVGDFDAAYRRMIAATSSSSPSRARSPMDGWPSFSTLPAIAGTCSVLTTEPSAPRRLRVRHTRLVFIIELTYTADLTEIDAHMGAHMEFLRRHYDSGRFVFSGRKVPRDGGIIVATGKNREEIEALVQEDPFHRHGLAELRIVEFRASQCADDLPTRLHECRSQRL